jgi:hypothetical protein
MICNLDPLLTLLISWLENETYVTQGKGIGIKHFKP